MRIPSLVTDQFYRISKLPPYVFPVINELKADFLVLVCNWQGKLQGDNARLGIAMNELGKYAHRLILITQPPELPKVASRESMRNGRRPPFFEDAPERALRLKSNLLLKEVAADNVIVVDIERLFVSDEGVIRFSDNAGNQLYNDSNHLSGIGANVVWPENSIYQKQREIIPGVVDNEMIRCQSAWTRSVSC
jgi:SGNH domain (fused to AT3 domains)